MRCAGTIAADKQVLAEDMILCMAKHGRLEWSATLSRPHEEEVYVKSADWRSRKLAETVGE